MNALNLYVVCVEGVPIAVYEDITTALQEVAFLNAAEEQIVRPEDRVEFHLSSLTIPADMLSMYLVTHNIEFKG